MTPTDADRSEAAAPGVLIADRNGIRFGNRAVQALLQYRGEELIGLPLEDVVRAFRDLRGGISDARRKDGSMVSVIVSVESVEPSDDGVLIVTLVPARRVTAAIQFLPAAAQLEVAQRITHVGSWQLDVNTNEVTWSDELFRIMCMTPRSSAPTYPEQESLFSPESWARLSAAISNSIATGRGYELTLEVVCADGTRKTAVARAESVCDPGTVRYLVGTFQDTTERERAAAELRLLTERLQLATSAAGMGVWDWQLDEDRMVWDRTMHELCGTTREDRTSGSAIWRAVVDPADILDFEREVREAITHRRDLEITIRTTHVDEVRYLRVAARAYYDTNTERAVRMVGVTWDITQATVSERALFRSEAFQRTILEHVGAALIATDPNGTITMFNPGAEQLLGYTAEEIVGRSTPALLHDPAEVAARRQVLEGELGVPILLPFDVFVVKSRTLGADANEWTYIAKDGRRIPVLLTVTTVRDPENRIIGYLGVAVDLSQRKRAELELVELNRLLAERSAQRDVLLQEVHHRVKNNLQVIASLINMQLRQLSDPSARSALQECRSRIQAIALVHERLYKAIDYSSLPFAEYVRLLVNNIIEGAGANARDIRFDCRIDPVALVVERAIPLGLILNELITNALKHAFPSRPGTIAITIEVDGNKVRLIVRDDGIGLPANFEMASSRSLGMQLVTSLVEQLDGTFEVVREPHTTFVVAAPIAMPVATRSETVS
jgi:two-component sensor histidine kinase